MAFAGSQLLQPLLFLQEKRRQLSQVQILIIVHTFDHWSPSPSLISYHLHLHHHLYQLTQSAKLSIPPPAALSYKSVNRCNGICLDFKEIINQLVLFILFLQMLSAFLAGISLCSFTALMYCRLMQRSSELFYLVHYHLTLFFSSLSLSLSEAKQES